MSLSLEPKLIITDRVWIEQSRYFEQTVAWTPIVLGAIAYLSAAVLAGIALTAAPNMLLPSPLVICVVFVTGIGLQAVGIILVRKAKKHVVRIAMNEVVTQAEMNIRIVVENVHLDASRFRVVNGAEGELPQIRKINIFSTFFFSVITTQAEQERALANALNQSVEAVNNLDINARTPNLKLQAVKYNRFLGRANLFRTKILNERSLNPIKSVEREWGLVVQDNVDEEDDIESTSKQPHITDKGKYYYSDNEPNHQREAFFIGLETQAKRLRRALTLGGACKYFSKGEGIEDIYQITDNVVSDPEKMRYHNVGHATLLLQLEGLNILTDPVFEGLNPVLYPRQTAPGMRLADLPPIDVIVISHNHRDHCDMASLKKLVPHQPVVLVPEGDEALFEELGFKRVVTHTWWQTTKVQANGKVVAFHSVPAKHWSGRGGRDAHSSLSCSWVIRPEEREGAIFFKGDSAVLEDDVTKQITAFVGAPIKVNFQPAGPNHRRSQMQSTHQSVLDAMFSPFEFDKDDPCPTYLIHHNVFELGTDRFNEALIIKEQLLAFLELDDLSEDSEEFKALPKFVREELQEKRLDQINEIGKEEFIDYLKKHFISPKIGEMRPLDLGSADSYDSSEESEEVDSEDAVTADEEFSD